MTGEGALDVYLRAKALERTGQSIIHLELGEPDFHPSATVVDALTNAIRDGKDRYCPMAGVPALKEELAAYLHRTRDLNVSPDNVVIAPGCKLSLFLSMMAILDPGDEVLYPDPWFSGIRLHHARAGCEACSICASREKPTSARPKRNCRPHHTAYEGHHPELARQSHRNCLHRCRAA